MSRVIVVFDMQYCYHCQLSKGIVTVVPRPLTNDPRLNQCIYCYGRASKRFVEVYIVKSIKFLLSFSNLYSYCSIVKFIKFLLSLSKV